MREIAAERITEVVARLCVDANCHLPEDMKERIRLSLSREDWPQGREILNRIIQNFEIADREDRPSVRIRVWPAFF